jgi:hypothetical protein
MMVCAIAGLFIAAAVISGIVTLALGLDDGGMQYDWRTERWVFVPERHDAVLEMIIRS